MKNIKQTIWILPLSVLFFMGACSYGKMDMDDGDYYPENTENENYTEYGENPFMYVSEDPVSTFSIDADGGSYANMRRYIRVNSSLPPAASVRVEEYINYFNYDYEAPTDENIAINTESSVCPWKEEHYLLRIGLKGKELAERPPSNFVFLIDVSGSMNSDDKLGILKTGFKAFADQLNEDDRVSIVTYAGEAGVILNPTPGNMTDLIYSAIDQLGAGGSTAGADGIITAYRLAEDAFIEGGNNRVVLGSDGDFNVGPSSTEELVELVEEKRESGIFLTVLGVGTGNLNDSMMEQIANNGNGNYEYVDNAEQVKKVFVYEYDKFFSVAVDVKIQIEFDPVEVLQYRLIGYENRILEDEDFENDSADAGEIGAGQCITALYEIVPAASIETSSYGDLELRYKRTAGESSRLISHQMQHKPLNFSDASGNMQFSASLAAFGMLLKESEYSGTADFQKVSDWAQSADISDPYGFKAEYRELINEAAGLK